MGTQTVANDKKGLGFKTLNIAKNMFLSYAITFVLMLIFAFVITYTNFPLSAVSGVSVCISLCGITLSGILNGRNSTEKGWLTGAISGFLYMFVLYVAGSLIYRDFSVNSHFFAMVFSGMLCAITGGIIGINNKPSKKR